MSASVKLEDGTMWPDPIDAGDLEWALRYGIGDLTMSQRLRIASIVSAYCQLAMRPDFARKPVMIRRAVASRLAAMSHGEMK